jgi:hypothetical protein
MNSLFRILTVVSTVSFTLVSLGSKSHAINEYWSGGFSPASSSNAGRILNHVPEASLGSQMYYTNLVKKGADAWNGITYRVSISSLLSSPSSDIRSQISTETIGSYHGLTIPFCASELGPVCTTKRWDYVVITGYNSITDSDRLNAAQKLEVWTHEFGHSLSLSHVTDTNATIMRRRVTAASLAIQNRDRENLRKKWGS